MIRNRGKSKGKLCMYANGVGVKLTMEKEKEELGKAALHCIICMHCLRFWEEIKFKFVAC